MPALARRGILLLALVGLGACSRPPPDSTPEGAVRVWLERMEASSDDPRATREAFAMLGPAARANLEGRADRASRVQGRRVEPYEMLAEGRFALRFRPKSMTASIEGDRATVDVVGADPAVDHAVVACAREGAAWRIEPPLPEPVAPTRRP